MTTQIAQAAQSVYTIQIPEDQGTVSQRWKGQDDRLIVHIQDAHSNLDAQVNLARTICSLLPQISENENPFIGIEGAFDSYDLKELRDFPLKEAREAIAEEENEWNLLEKKWSFLVQAFLLNLNHPLFLHDTCSWP